MTYTVIDDSLKDSDGRVCYLVRCSCGLERVLTRGNFNRSTMCRKCRSASSTGENATNYMHGGTGTRLHNIWRGVLARCNNPNRKCYCNYGGRGISVCEEWREFVPFREWAMANGYADNLTIDRVDVDGNYSPANCRWLTVAENNGTRRKTKSV